MTNKIVTTSASGVFVTSRRRFVAGVAAAGVAAPFVMSRASAAGLDKVRMAVWSPKLAEEANVYVAEEKGYFKDAGVEVEWVPGLGSGDALIKMLGGNADIGFVGPEAIYLAADKGSELKAVYNIYPQNCFNVVSLKSKPISSPKDLKGKKIGVISMSSGTRYNLNNIFALNGMSEKDVELIALGLNGAPALIEGKVDALGSTDTILVAMQAAGIPPVEVMWARDYLNTATDIFTIEAKNYEPKKDVFTRFLKAFKKGTEDMIKNPEEAAAIAAKVAIDGKDAARVLAQIKLRNELSQSEGTKKNGLGWLDFDILTKGAKLYKDVGFIKADLDITKIATNDLVKSI